MNIKPHASPYRAVHHSAFGSISGNMIWVLALLDSGEPMYVDDMYSQTLLGLLNRGWVNVVCKRLYITYAAYDALGLIVSDLP